MQSIGSPASNGGGIGAWGQSMAQSLASGEAPGCQTASQHGLCQPYNGFGIAQYCSFGDNKLVGQSVGL
eukprot:scaffold124417_cov19-Tisochrysis_lutea.AAC.4